jgi:hypothetical protein
MPESIPIRLLLEKPDYFTRRRLIKSRRVSIWLTRRDVPMANFTGFKRLDFSDAQTCVNEFSNICKKNQAIRQSGI